MAFEKYAKNWNHFTSVKVSLKKPSVSIYEEEWENQDSFKFEMILVEENIWLEYKQSKHIEYLREEITRMTV